MRDYCGACRMKGSGIACFARVHNHPNLCHPEHQDWIERRSRAEGLPEDYEPPPVAPRPTPAVVAPRVPGVVRVGMATPALTIGGAERWTLSLLEATGSPPFRWEGVACYNRGLGHAPLVAEVMRQCPVSWELEGIHALARRVDVMVCWGLPFMPAEIKAVNPKVKVVLVSHGICEWTRQAVAQAEACEALAAVGRPSVRPFPEDQRSRVRVIYNTTAARPATVLCDEQKAAWGLDPGRKVLLYLGRVSPEKYPEGAALAAKELPEPWSVVVVGPGAERYGWPVKPGDLASGKLVFAGPTDDPGSALGAADAMLLPSWGEGFSIALIEAWHARVPVIGTVVGIAEEYPDLLRPIPRGASGTEIAAAVAADEADPEGTAARVERAHRAATETFTFQRFKEGWRSLLLETCPPAPEPEGPSLLRRAANLGRELVAGNLRLHGDDELTARRVAICEACEWFKPSNRTCSVASCGCYIDKKSATYSDCPKGFWPRP